MCSNCYHSRGRNKKAWKCEHKQKAHYALGICQNCYQTLYSHSKKTSLINSNTYELKDNFEKTKNNEHENKILY